MSILTLTVHDDLVRAYRHRDLRQAMYDEGQVVMQDVLLDLHGAEHKARRKLVNRVFNRPVFTYYERAVIPQLIERSLAPFLEAGRGDMIEIGYRTAMNFTAHFSGVDLQEGDHDATDALLALVRKFSEGATLVHSTRDKDEVRAEVGEALDLFETRFLEASLARRRELIGRFERGELGEDALPKDVLTVLLRNEDSLHLPPEVVRREIAFYLQAGAHSTVNSTAHAMHAIFRWLETRPGDAGRVTRDPLFVQRCVHEAMRLHPASPVAWRRPTTKIRFTCRDHPGGIEIGPEDLVVLELLYANRDPAIFGRNPDLFDPDREVAEGHKPFGLSFGTGLHACLGQDLAAGLVPDSSRGQGEQLLGTVPRLAWTLLRHGARPDPDDPPTRDPGTSRGNWGRYPVRFDPALALSEDPSTDSRADRPDRHTRTEAHAP